MARTPMIAGNWKMHKNCAETRELLAALKSAVGAATEGVEIVVCPPFTSLSAAVEVAAGTPVGIGAQNLHWEKSGAFTGEISADMLCEIRVKYVIIGHSERRQYFNESDATVNRRLQAALAAGLIPIVCVGETLQEREADRTESVVSTQIRGGLQGFTTEQLKTLVIAYEPVWAIGTGRTASPAQAQEVHAFIRQQIRDILGNIADDMRILYGGSVKPDNARELLGQKDIDGALVGGASLKAADFAGIIDGAR